MIEDIGFRTVFGRGLLPEWGAFGHRPALLVTMEDLWPLLRERLDGGHLAGVHFVRSLEVADLERELASLPDAASIVGMGGGQAVDVAKYIAWRTRRPLFQVPTATSVNAPFGHRSGVRIDGVVDVALRTLGAFVREAGLWYSVADVRPFTDETVARVHDLVLERWGPWEAGR